ncbi:hypothetical protein [Salinarchaeum sp. Harcht-Bsk1]|uniref:hypothetical protein n=1 Tax=Salinarchaeum sp. Harcht-Bsk1 TaxID=1333523 RepID=UPI001651A0DA|nr:hypothetical protein [Salinarchaeum sp. Harcht-Bsk1]
MPESYSPTDRDAQIRERYDEYEVGESVVGVISDPENEHAWIWSDELQEIET